MRTFEYKPEWRNWQTRLTQNQVLRSVGSSPTSGTLIKLVSTIVMVFRRVFIFLELQFNRLGTRNSYGGSFRI